METVNIKFNYFFLVEVEAVAQIIYHKGEA
jgi:hypothetical protein